MQYPLLISRNPDAIVDWARRLVSQLERDASPANPTITPEIASGVVVMDLRNTDTFLLKLDQNVTTLTVIIPRSTDEKPFTWRLMVEQDGIGGHTLTWPGAWKWPGQTAPVVTATPLAIDIFELTILRGVYYGRVLGQDMG